MPTYYILTVCAIDLCYINILGIHLYVVSLSSYIPEYWAYVVPYCLL